MVYVTLSKIVGDLQQNVEHVTAWNTCTLDIFSPPAEKVWRYDPKNILFKHRSPQEKCLGEQKKSHLRRKNNP